MNSEWNIEDVKLWKCEGETLRNKWEEDVIDEWLKMKNEEIEQWIVNRKMSNELLE